MRPIDADELLDKAICTRNYFEIKSLIERMQSITQLPNDPLTLEQLREMDGEPVWLHAFSAVQKKTKIACWAILECCSSASAVFLRAGVNSRLTKWFCNYGERWLAYRRKPEEGAS